MFPSLQEIFLGRPHNRVSRKSPGNLRVSGSLREFPESPGVFLAACPSLRGVSGQNRTLPGVSERSPSVPEASGVQRLWDPFILLTSCELMGSGAFARDHVWELTSFAGSFSLSAKHEHRRSAEPELVMTFEGKPPSVVRPRFPVSGFPKTSGPGKVVGGALETVPGFPGNASGC